MTTKTTMSDPKAVVGDSHTARCPCCRQMTSLREESIVIGTEILCRECGAILAVERTAPLTLLEIELEDLD